MLTQLSEKPLIDIYLDPQDQVDLDLAIGQYKKTGNTRELEDLITNMRYKITDLERENTALEEDTKILEINIEEDFEYKINGLKEDILTLEEENDELETRIEVLEVENDEMQELYTNLLDENDLI